MLRFRSRLALLNARSEEFLNILVQLGGYCTLGQAKRIELANSDPRVLVRLRGLEQIGFLRKIAGYPVIFQVTKSATRLSACGSEGQTPTPAGNGAEPAVYLDACGWPAEFIFDHEMKVTTLTAGGCPMSAIPHRGGEPYLWEEFILWLGDGRVAVALEDDHQRSPFSQVRISESDSRRSFDSFQRGLHS